MAMGLFDQLTWLTNKVKKLCCIAENNQSVERYTITSTDNSFPLPVPTGNTRYVVYELQDGVAQVVDITGVPGREGQVLTICINPQPSPYYSVLAVLYGIPGDTGTYGYNSNGNSCMTFYYIGGYWVGQVVKP